MYSVQRGVQVLLTPVQAPRANAYAERWMRTVRAECLDWLLIVSRGHLEQILRVYVAHYNRHRPHRALQLKAPDPAAGPTSVGEDQQGIVHRRDLLGGLLQSTNELHERLCAPFRQCGRNFGPAAPDTASGDTSHPCPC
jgi:hypothetical protein